MKRISGCNRATKSSVRGTIRRGISCARGGTKSNSEGKGKFPMGYLEYMDDVNKGR
jgi:hypothetical protein